MSCRGTPSEVSVEGGAQFPVVGVGLDWSELDGWSGPAVVLWITGVEGVDAEAYLRPRDARQLVSELTARLEQLKVRCG